MSTTTTSNTVKEKESTTSTTSSTDDNSKTQNVLKKSDEVLEKPLEGEELKAMLMKQIEYYFSKENLANDRYLVSQMNAETFVPIQVIANFKMIKSHSSDIELITKVMKECPSVVVDETNTLVKPKVKSHRNIIILRDIPSSTPIEEVKAIFNTEGCGKISDIKSDIGDSWIVSFENDDIALSTLDIVRNQSFKNEPIKARIKTETAFRSFLPGNSGSVQPNANSNPRNNYQYNYPAFVPNTANYAPWMRNNQYYSEGKDGSQASHGGHREGSSGYRGGHSSEGGSRGGYEGSRRGRGGDSSSGYRGRGGRRGGAEGRGALEGRGDSSRGEYRGSKDKSDVSSNGTTNVNTNSSSAHSSSTRSRRGSAGQLQLGPSNFPPLPSKKASGYTQDYIKWSRQDFLDVINQSKENDIKKPEGLVDFMSLEKFTTDLDLLKPYPIREEETSSSTEQATTNSSNSTSTTDSTKDQTKSENTANNTTGVDSNTTTTTTTTTTSDSESKPTQTPTTTTEETTKS